MKFKKSFFLLILSSFLMLSCKNISQNAISKIPNRDCLNSVLGKLDEDNQESDVIIYKYQDSLNIGEKGDYKVNVISTALDDGREALLKIDLFRKDNGRWLCIQNIIDTLAQVIDPDVEFTDLNNNGVGDLSFKSELAGRGFNEIRKHYIFNEKSNQLICLKNSFRYPNLTYNDYLDCVESTIASGGYTTIFLQIEADSLREFASIDMYDNKRIVKVVNKRGAIATIDESFYNLENDNVELIYGDYDYHQLKRYKNK